MAGFWRGVLTGRPDPITSTALEVDATFAVDPESVPAEVFGLAAYSTATAPVARVSRREAVQVPAVKRARDLIAGSLGTLPLVTIRPDLSVDRTSWLMQPERDVPRSVTMTKTIEDILYEGIAWWYVTGFDWRGYPAQVIRLDPRSVDVQKDGRVSVTLDGHRGISDQWPTDKQLIRFDSPNDPLLEAGARAIRQCLLLDAAASRHADGTPPSDFFTPKDGVDPGDADDIREILDAWQTARQTRSTAYVPGALDYHLNGWNPEQLQLSAQRDHAVLEIARVAGVDPEELGVSTTSRTYANMFERRKSFIDMTLGGYRAAIEDRLSMGDVTPRGTVTRFDLDAFLRTDALSRWTAAKVGIEVGAITPEEVREGEGRPALGGSSIPAPETPQEEPMPEPAPIAASFDTTTTMDASAPIGTVFSVDTETRTIRGMAVPYGVTGRKDGKLFAFSKGTVRFDDVKRVKLWVGHEKSAAVGVAFELEDTDDGLVGAFKVARGAEGDRALSMAEDGVWDGLSIGPSEGAKYQLRDGVYHSVDIPIHEVSLTPAPVFGGARVSSVAFDANEQENLMPETETTTTEVSTDFSAITDAITKGFADLTNPQGGPETISAGRPVTVVDEAPCYRFDGGASAHDFSTDLIAFGRDSNGEAGERVMAFLTEQFSPNFDVDKANVTTLNPARQRADMYVDERRFRTPLYDALHKGGITDSTPFVVPRFDSASGLVAPHVEGVEPTSGAFAATSQTITPSAVSGKVEITREVWDQGGNPQVSGLIWTKMVQHYFAALESAAFTTLNAAAPTAITITTGATDDDLVNEVEAVIVDLNFVAGGNTFDYAGTHANLYRRLAAAVDASGRKLLPQYGPANANGVSRSRFASLDVAGTEFMPVPSLGAASGATGKSYLLDTTSVHLWNSAPQRLEFQYRVAYVDLAIWGYVAAAITDLAGVRRLDYDPTV